MTQDVAFPVGRYVGKERDPNAAPFLISIGESILFHKLLKTPRLDC